MKKTPRVVIVGRMNVGKSTLFNRLSVDVKSLTLDYEGVTRDFLKDVVCWQDRCFELIDTGGISLRKTGDKILERVRLKAIEVVKSADVVLFVCDAKIGLLPEDREISKLLHSLCAHVILVVNKIDADMSKENLYEFERLGHETAAEISAHHGIGIAELLEFIVHALPVSGPVQKDDSSCKVVLLGKPNVGKSSLMNLLLKQDRSIVTDRPGTTREPITETIKFYKEDIVLTDTAGVRRKRRVQEELEGLMVKTSFKALKDAHIALLLIDSSAGRLSDQELKLAFYALKNHKALMILFNKQDLVDQEIAQKMEFNLEPYKHLMKKVSWLRISCKTRKHIGRLLEKIQKLCQRHSQTFPPDEISLLFKEALARRPLYKNTNPLRILHARQISTAPITILLIVNEPKWFGESQLAYFENQFRRAYDLEGVPVRFVTRKKG